MNHGACKHPTNLHYAYRQRGRRFVKKNICSIDSHISGSDGSSSKYRELIQPHRRLHVPVSFLYGNWRGGEGLICIVFLVTWSAVSFLFPHLHVSVSGIEIFFLKQFSIFFFLSFVCLFSICLDFRRRWGQQRKKRNWNRVDNSRELCAYSCVSM